MKGITTPHKRDKEGPASTSSIQQLYGTFVTRQTERSISIAESLVAIPIVREEMDPPAYDPFAAYYEAVERDRLRNLLDVISTPRAATMPTAMAQDDSLFGRMIQAVRHLCGQHPYYAAFIIPFGTLCFLQFFFWSISPCVPWRRWLEDWLVYWGLEPSDYVSSLVIEIVKWTIIQLFWALYWILAMVWQLLCYICSSRPFRSLYHSVRSAAANAIARADDAVRWLRFNSMTDRLYLRYQQTYSWIRRYLLPVFGLCLIIWLLSPFISTYLPQLPFNKFYSPHDQRPQNVQSTTSDDFYDQPPHSSYYASEVYEQPWIRTVIEDAFPVTSVVEMAEESILAERMVGDVSRDDIFRPPKGKTIVGDKMVYCMSCRQWHCCELPY